MLSINLNMPLVNSVTSPSKEASKKSKFSKWTALAIGCLLLPGVSGQLNSAAVGSRFKDLTQKHCKNAIPLENCLISSDQGRTNIQCAQLSPSWLSIPAYHETDGQKSLICPDGMLIHGNPNSTFSFMGMIDATTYSDKGRIGTWDVEMTTYWSEGGKWYEGQWKNGEWDGEGIEYWPGGAKEYEGQWKNGKRDGKGIEYRTDGIKMYEGQWKNGKRDGEGIAYMWDGTKWYEGQWKNGKMDGKGIVYWGDGIKWYEGQWRNGEADGEGIEYWPNGIKSYEGQWKKEKRDGKGIEYWPDGTKKFEGQWEKGEPQRLMQFFKDYYLAIITTAVGVASLAFKFFIANHFPLPPAVIPPPPPPPLPQAAPLLPPPLQPQIPQQLLLNHNDLVIAAPAA